MGFWGRITLKTHLRSTRLRLFCHGFITFDWTCDTEPYPSTILLQNRSQRWFQRWSCRGRFALETGSVSEQPLLADTVCKAFRPVGVFKPMWMVFFCCTRWFKLACCFYQRRMVANGIRVFDDKPWNFLCLSSNYGDCCSYCMFIFRVLAHWKYCSECTFLALKESSGLNVADEHEYLQLGWLVSHFHSFWPASEPFPKWVEHNSASNHGFHL